MLSLLESSHRVAINLSDYDFLRLFKDKNEKIYFRLIQEKKKTIKKLECGLNKGEYEKIKEVFKEYQNKGYGVYFVVHSEGTKKTELSRINAYMQDIDLAKFFARYEQRDIIKDENGNEIVLMRTKEEIESLKIKFLESLKKFSLEPSIIIETKNGFHIYWLTRQDSKETYEKDMWQKIEKAFVKYFQDNYEPEFPEHIDKRINNFTKVMRVNNYLHLKDPSDSFQVKCIFLNKENKYTKEQMMEAIDYKEPENIIKQAVPAYNAVNIKRHTEHITASREVIHAIRGIDLVSYLGLEVGIGKNFICHYHDDKSPSAAIYFENGEYRYFCNSSYSNCPASGHGIDLIDIIKLQYGYDTNQVIKYLKDSCGIKSSWEISQLAFINRNTGIIDDILADTNSQYKNLKRMLSVSYIYIAALYQECKEKLHDCFTLNGENLFFVSNQHLSDKIGKRVNKTNQYINLMCTLGLVKKVNYNNLNKRISDKALELAEKKHKNPICFYSIPFLSEEILQTAEIRAELMYRTGFSVKGISRVYINNAFGEEFADSVYQVKVERSNTNTSIFDFIAFTINICVCEQGYFTKDMLYAANRRLSKNKRFGLDKLEYEYRRNLPEILDCYGLVLLKKPSDIQARGINTKKNIIVKT